MERPLRFYQPTIADLMGLVLIVAVAVAFRRGGVPSQVVLPAMLLLSAGVGLAHWLWFVVVPQRVIPWRARGDADRERAWLERVLAVPSLGNDVVKALPRFLLLNRYQHDKRYAEAEALGRSILAHRARLMPAFASLVHQRLADCLEALDRRPEADAQRALADDCLKGSKETFLGRQAQAKLYESENRHAEAYDAYEKGLALVPPHLDAVRAEFMAHLMMTSFNAGRPAETVRWSEAVRATDRKGVYHQTARRMGAVALGNLGRLDEAEKLTRETADLERDPVKRSEVLATAASYASRRGDLDGSDRAARQAEALSPGTGRMPWIVLAENARIRGRHDEALAAYARTRAVPPLVIPSAERRIRAAIAKAEAGSLAELGRTDEALALLNGAEAEIGNDPKLGPEVDARFALVYSLKGDRVHALARIATADDRRQAVLADNTSQRSYLFDLGRAALLIDEPEQAELFWNAYLEFEPSPVYLPSAFYHLAECRRLLGDPASARALYLRAASTRFGTLHERLARERLALSPA